ncbi:hypothetical protein [Saccharicrinis aurantiacus]|uniref:hypothetical protein n=1 Tax=Saccharicrinis aurantiacus TaxID=1849719 RepID=UPI0011151975|nr:hypothetical protein [Saccharicrinis aurantiacus]
MKVKIFLVLLLLTSANIYADIAPHPIKAKSISTPISTSIRMVEEKVTIDLYNDSSVVKCIFYMKNLGEDESINIGFPDMNFYYHRISSIEDISKFKVKENGKSLNSIIDHVNCANIKSDTIKPSLEDRLSGKYPPVKSHLDWYLWSSQFKHNESKIIEVEYTLPYGRKKRNNQRFFKYLLNTGTGWRGTIGKAEIIVNLVDIPTDSLSNISPQNYTIVENQIKWKFTNLDPKESDDINIYYNSDIIYPDDKMISCFVDGQRTENGIEFIKTISPDEIAYLTVVKKTEALRKYPNSPYGAVIIYTKDYTLTCFNNLMQEKQLNLLWYNAISYDLLVEEYELKIAGDVAPLYKVSELSVKLIDKVTIVKIKNGKDIIEVSLIE